MASARFEDSLRRLVDDGVLSDAQADAVRAALERSRGERTPSRWLAEVAGYVGGALMLGSAAWLLATSWERLTDVSRSALLAAITVALLAAGVAIAGGPSAMTGLRAGESAARRRVVGVLWGLASGSAAGAAGVLADRHTAVAAGAGGLVIALAGYVALQTAPGLIAATFFSVMLSVSTMDELVGATPLTAGAVLIAVGVIWTLLAAWGPVVPQPLGLGGGAAIALIGAQQPLGESGSAPWAYGLTLAVAFGCFLLYRVRRHLVLLVAGVIAVGIAVPEAVWDMTNGAVGGAAILLIAGAALVTASGLGLRMSRAQHAGGPPA